MYIAFNRVEECLERLRPFHPFFGQSFLVCKAGKLPIGRAISFPINSKEEEFFRKYYKPDPRSKHFFTPFRTSSRAGRWLSSKYASSGSQKTRTQGDLAKAFIHTRGTDLWGWSKDYVRVLRDKLDRDRAGRVPLFWLAVWLFRERQWTAGTKPEHLVDALLKEFHITREEHSELFQTPVAAEASEPLLDEERYTDERLLEIVEPAPGAAPEEGGTLRFLELRGVGPANLLSFAPAERLSIITGDNGLGKTFRRVSTSLRPVVMEFSEHIHLR